ncbi:SPRY domain-containing protein 3-like [Seriola lalandi dorsalis]|uniref:SPRY domain containing 3 n=1 Tax=Seriola lalandi dorsalis TaxID=1841481 RepID=A0A3B4WIY6_SERLL|nr:SPRY domain-containing protein 3-like [Seriola lalandi dorsalis]XP_023248768.1 SPRY domain-containing protein 3-like [Seriola lalandi dorsalis]XP_056240045.1 SPRY domain-containing protein 3 isoform X1 [Seriola aureovittata]XP_056240046.1 SPRY domain-containing protein 3 isoform X1 [Seriola aureovittata]
MDDINVLHHRCLLNLRRRIRDIGDGRPAQERYMRLQKDGDTLSYQGNSEEVGCYVAGHPLSKGNCYFEVTIVDTGVRGTIAVGLVPKFYRLDHQPGWLPYSVAYHADNGKLYNGNPVGQQFGPKCARGDRIGCGIHSENIEAGFTTVFFTKNGKEVGSVEVPVLAEGLFPAVGMHSMGEEVKVDLQAEWFLEEDDSMMMVDSHEDDWGRLYDVRVSGTLLEYVGKGKSIMDVGLAQARQPLTTRCHYYEVEIVDAGEKCYIALGLARRDYPRNRHPGWSRGSVAYHADDGKIFHGSGVGDAFGPRCFKGDIMGCGIMFPRDYILDGEGDMDDWERLEVRPGHAGVQNVLYLNDEEEEEEDGEEAEQGQEGRKVTVFFTRNGKLMGRREMVVPPGGLYPTVGMLSSGEKVKVDLHPLSG